MYSLSSPTRVTLKCRTTGPPQDYEPSQEEVLVGTGILPDSSDCYVYSENFKLLLHSLGRTTIRLSKARILLPSIERILNEDEETVIEPLRRVGRVKAIIQRSEAMSSRPGIDVASISYNLRHGPPAEGTSVIEWIFGVLIVFSVCSLIYIYNVHSPK